MSQASADGTSSRRAGPAPREIRLNPARYRAGFLQFAGPDGHDGLVKVAQVAQHDDLVEYLAASCPLSRAEAARVVADVLGYFSELPEEYVRRRHRELKAGGSTNDLAFRQIAAEIPQRRYAAPDLSLRQLRRMVYG
jgi:hypothetical protein